MRPAGKASGPVHVQSSSAQWGQDSGTPKAHQEAGGQGSGCDSHLWLAELPLGVLVPQVHAALSLAPVRGLPGLSDSAAGAQARMLSRGLPGKPELVGGSPCCGL